MQCLGGFSLHKLTRSASHFSLPRMSGPSALKCNAMSFILRLCIYPLSEGRWSGKDGEFTMHRKSQVRSIGCLPNGPRAQHRTLEFIAKIRLCKIPFSNAQANHIKDLITLPSTHTCPHDLVRSTLGVHFIDAGLPQVFSKVLPCAINYYFTYLGFSSPSSRVT